MLRIRFHGRGGHGVKTASRILGTAGFLEGLQAQDSPVYGAERRGAAVVAFTRLDSAPILERGTVEHPDLIIVGDETLLGDAGAGTLIGAESAAAIFVNAPAGTGIKEQYSLAPSVVVLDVTQRTLETLGKASALSAGLAAVAARLTGLISEAKLLEAVREELRDLGLPREFREKNVLLARDLFESLDAIPRPPRESLQTSIQGKLEAVGYDDPVRGTPSILAAGSAMARPTGAWRLERPEIDYELCTRCGLCLLRCPDGAIALDEKGYPVIDYDHCKGCMICLQECPLGAFRGTKEVRSW